MLHQTQANLQGSWNPLHLPATVLGCFAMACPVQAGTSASLEIISKGLTLEQLVECSMAQAASLLAQVEH